MKERAKKPAPDPGLRGRAEARLRDKGEPAAAASEADARKMLHELQVHQVELEMQNEALRTSREEFAALLEQYTNLYDLAPTGYATLGPDGVIRLINLTGAAMFRVERSRLTGEKLEAFLSPESRPAFAAFLKDVFAGGGAPACEATVREGGAGRVVRIATLARGGGEECRITIEDRTEHDRADALTRARLRIILATAAESGTMDELLRIVLDEIEAQTGSTIAFCHFLEADQETLSLQGWSTNTLRKMCTAEGKGSHYPVAQAGVWADAARQKRPVIHNDYASLPGRKGLPAGHAPVVRELVVPLMRGGRVVAIIGVGNKAGDYDAADIETVSLLGDFSWEIVERKRLEASARRGVLKLREANVELERFNRLMVDREMRMIDLKKEVNELCVQTGRPPRYPLEFEK